MSAGVPGALRTARPMPQISPGTSQGSVSSRSLPSAFARSISAVTTSSRPTDSAASPQTTARWSIASESSRSSAITWAEYVMNSTNPSQPSSASSARRPSSARRSKRAWARASSRLSLVGKWR